jgi:hypothetical protein
MMDHMDNPYQSPNESGEQQQPRFNLRRAVGMVFIILSGIIAAVAPFPLVIMLVMGASDDQIIAAVGWLILMSLAALGAFWIGWRRWRVPRQRPGMTVYSASGPATESTSQRELT